jgi:hypothetical protein
MPSASRENPHDQVQAGRRDHGAHADQDGRAQHAVHSPQVYGRAARLAARHAASGPPRADRAALGWPDPRD